MSVSWPAISTAVLENSFQEVPPDNVLRSSTDTGPAKIRRRATSAVRRVRWQQNLVTADIATLDTFYVTTSKYGSIDFSRAHPRTGSTVYMRFLSPPSYSPAPNTPGRWLVNFDCEVLP